FVGLDMLEIDLTLLDQVLVHLLAVLPGALQPRGYGPLVQQEGVHDRLDRTAPTEQAQHYQHQLRRALQAEQRRPTRGGKGVATDGAPVAPLLLTVHPDRALAGLATGRAVQVGAKCVLRVHRCSPLDMTWYSRLTGEPVDPLRRAGQRPPALTTVPCGATFGLIA